MKNLLRLFVLVAAISIASTAQAAADYYLKIEGGKGEKRIVHCVNDACTVTGLAVGEYTVSVCLENGKAPAADITATHTISAPRDAASGQATGKRQHQSIRITKEWGPSTPLLRIAIDEPGAPLELQVKIGKSRSNIQNN